MGKYGNTILTHVEKGTYTKRLIYQKSQHTKSSVVVIKLHKIFRQNQVHTYMAFSAFRA